MINRNKIRRRDIKKSKISRQNISKSKQIKAGQKQRGGISRERFALYKPLIDTIPELVYFKDMMGRHLFHLVAGSTPPLRGRNRRSPTSTCSGRSTRSTRARAPRPPSSASSTRSRRCSTTRRASSRSCAARSRSRRWSGGITVWIVLVFIHLYH